MKYEINALNKLSSNTYLISNVDTLSAIDDILKMNDFIKEAKCKNMINSANLHFKGDRNVCYFEYIPLTPKGKISKFPQILHFFTTDSSAFIADNVFGEIYYFENGNIGKSKITHWDKNSITVIECSIINNILSLNKITKTILKTGEKSIVFKAQK